MPAAVNRQPLIVGQQYTRAQIGAALGVPETRQQGNWHTGYDHVDDNFVIFAGVGTAGRTGHDYGNVWSDAEQQLNWSAKGGTRRGQPEIESIIGASGRVLIFTRAADRDPFTFRGRGIVADVQPTSPVRIIWRMAADPTDDPDELERRAASHAPFAAPPTGQERPATTQRNGKSFIRDPEVVRYVRQEANGHCEACGGPAPFSTVRGPFLETHHMILLANNGPDTPWNTVAVCPNCHRRLHLSTDRATFIETVYARVARLRR